MDSLAKKHNRRDVCKALENLPKELDDTYDEAMQRIWSNEEDAKLAEQVLSWISYAFRPLTIIEVQHALAVGPGNVNFDEDALPDEDVLVSVCAGLVTLDKQSKIIRLVHYTTQEYFERIRMTRFPYAQTSIATACLIYISFDVFAKGYCRSDQEMETQMHKYPFLKYAAQHWGDHARGDLEETIKEQALKFLRHKSKVMCSIQVMHLPEYRCSGSRQDFPEDEDVTGLHLVASIGLAKIVRLLLEQEGVDANSKDRYNRTPLWIAAFSGHEAVVQILLEHEGVDADSKDSDGQTPLSWAAENGHEAVVRLLLEQEGVDVDSKDNGGRTPLSWAVSGGHEAMVRLLLEHKGVDAASKDWYNWTPLSWATFSGHEAMVRLLLEREGVDADSKDQYGQTSLWVAAANGHEAVVKLLLEREGVDANSKDRCNRTPLWVAAFGGHEAVVQMLLEHEGVDADSKNSDGQTPLSRAAESGYEAVVQLLLERGGVDVDSKDNDGRTPLSWAAKNGREAVVRLLTPLISNSSAHPPP
jgi:ankyrin repeat protein